jgi:hypothetical protein
MKIKKSELSKLIKESVASFIKKEVGKKRPSGNTNFTFHMEIGDVQVEADVSPEVGASYWQPAEGGEVELLSFWMDGKDRTLEELARMESQVSGEDITEQELYDKIEEMAKEHGADEPDYHGDANWGY